MLQRSCWSLGPWGHSHSHRSTLPQLPQLWPRFMFAIFLDIPFTVYTPMVGPDCGWSAWPYLGRYLLGDFIFWGWTPVVIKFSFDRRKLMQEIIFFCTLWLFSLCQCCWRFYRECDKPAVRMEAVVYFVPQRRTVEESTFSFQIKAWIYAACFQSQNRRVDRY